MGTVGFDWSIAGSIEVSVEVIGAGDGSNVRSMLLQIGSKIGSALNFSAVVPVGLLLASAEEALEVVLAVDVVCWVVVGVVVGAGATVESISVGW